MLYTLLRWALFAMAIMLIAWIVPGIGVSGFLSALIVALVMGIINAFIKPVISLITLPVNFFTLGLFGLVVNALLFWLAGVIVPGFEVSGFLSALLGSILLSLLGVLINKID